MGRYYKTAQGKPVDIDGLILTNERTIAVGNMNVNARGDELGPGGSVVTTRNQSMDDYYKLNTNSTGQQAKDIAIKHQTQGITVAQGKVGQSQLTADLTNPLEMESEQQNNEPVMQSRKQPTLRGNLADAVAKQTVVNQPVINTGQTKGPKRI